MTSWEQLKSELGDSVEAREGYRRAQLTYEFGRRVRELREVRGWSQGDLAKMLRTSQPSIARMEAGGSEPRLSMLARLAELFGVGFVVQGEEVLAWPAGAGRGGHSESIRRPRPTVAKAG